MTLTPSAGTPRRLSLVPLRDLTHLAPGDVLVQVVGNLLVFAALGFFLPIRYPVGLLSILLIAAAGSTLIETLQYVLALGRVSSTDDVLVNTAGAGLAACCSLLWWRTRSLE
jgi:glycopeptide antibiotics resistance protein